ncbi:hypothetical protein Bbelb_368450 [Branchiostoma belcheri]|nr:hypothetical protein Bbelb_368450 [Branchiostoma belcheri]
MACRWGGSVSPARQRIHFLAVVLNHHPTYQESEQNQRSILVRPCLQRRHIPGPCCQVCQKLFQLADWNVGHQSHTGRRLFEPECNMTFQRGERMWGFKSLPVLPIFGNALVL